MAACGVETVAAVVVSAGIAGWHILVLYRKRYCIPWYDMLFATASKALQSMNGDPFEIRHRNTPR